MNFLDMLNDPNKMGLMAAAARMMEMSGPSRTPVGLGQIMGGGFGAYTNTAQAIQQRQAEEEERRQMMQMRGLQMQEMQGQLGDRDRARQLEARIRAAAQASMQTPEQQAASLPGGPTIENAAQIPSMKGGMDVQGFLGRVSAIDPLEGMKYAKQLAPAAKKVSKWEPVDVGGKILFAPFFEDGSAGTPVPLEMARKLEARNTGGTTEMIDPYTGEAKSRVRNTMSPDAVASNALGWANNRVARDRLEIDRQEAATRATAVKAPTEFQGKSAAYGLRAQEAHARLEQLAGKYSPAAINSKVAIQDWPIVGGAFGAATNALALNDNDQKAEQAQRDFVNAVLRQESGAAISASEFDNARRQYFPQPGDSAAVIEQKKKNRETAIRGFQQNAGRAAMEPNADGQWGITKVN